MQFHRKRRTPFAAYRALAFNLILAAAPILGVKAIASAYGGSSGFESTEATVEATKRAMEQRLAQVASQREGAPRDVWAQLVRDELEANNMPAARGLLMAAPAMLKGADAAALRARIAVSDKKGDDALIEAALTYLPEDVQLQFDRQNEAVSYLLREAIEATTIVEPPSGPQLSRIDASDLADTGVETDEGASFSILGDMRDLALQAARWTRGDPIDEFAFVLSGVGLTSADPPAQQGASIVLSARRAERLDPDFDQYLQRRLFAAASPQRLSRELEADFSGDFGYGSNGQTAVEAAFRNSIDPAQLQPLLQEFRIIHEISEATSQQSAVAILSQVENGGDLRRARLIAKAGGDRAVALAQHDGVALLDTARMVVSWSDRLRIQLGALGICMAAMAALAVSVFWHSVMKDQPKRRSAVYRFEQNRY